MALFTIGAVTRPLVKGARSTRALRVVDLVLTNVCVALVGAEIALRILSSYSESPVFSRPSNSVSEMLAI